MLLVADSVLRPISQGGKNSSLIWLNRPPAYERKLTLLH